MILDLYFLDSGLSPSLNRLQWVGQFRPETERDSRWTEERGEDVGGVSGSFLHPLGHRCEGII